ncbi:magnesium transporter protein [Blastocystis sp. subtype 4]|uniref:magnesium transporter protein n=1 Tax=Blastocystis sp. subtype 4 TaxID=944170 RepID=UPI00071209DE|nr:magnesium transporter protein [Blastocystis sp. subtype 4]KNB43761.1 magnesium transporter protein [Blastocystis sp. subtype 4]|eukprot:XP_014527202.1 magnesium transporter protein [Blastocystis sp. subtype 4]
MSILTHQNTAVLTEDQFNEYVVGHMRDYDTVLLFSYTKTPNECISCVNSNDAFAKTAQRWNKMNLRDHHVIFMVITLEEDPELFDVLGLTSYPSLVYLPENHPISEITEEERSLLVIEKDDTVFTESEIQRFLTRITGVEFIDDSDMFLTLLVIVLAAILLIVFGYTFLFHVDFFYSFFGDHQAWYHICYGFMIIVVSGILYDLFRGAPLVSVTRQGVSLFSVRGATVVEGVLYGCTIIFISSQFITLLSLDKKSVEHENSLSDTISTCLAIISVCLLFMVFCFNVKNPWYIRGLLSF